MTNAPKMSMVWKPEAVQVSTMVYIVCTPSQAMRLERAGKLIYVVFGSVLYCWPRTYVAEPLGEGGGTYIQDLTWLRVGWIHGQRPKKFNGPKFWTAAGASKHIVFRDKRTGRMVPCTHDPNYGSIYSAWKKLTQDMESGELQRKVTAHSEYQAMKRRVTGDETGLP